VIGRYAPNAAGRRIIMTTELRETEQKYECDAGIVLPPLQGLPGVATVSEPEAETLVAEYYDSEDLRLLLAGVTLRRREGGPDEGWHLKLPDDAAARAGPAREMSTRGEIRMSLARGDRDRLDRRPAGNGDSPAGRDPVPAELARLVRVHTRGGLLRPVARIETRRRRTTLRNVQGQSLAEIAVDQVAARTLGGATAVVRWNEVEAELTGASPRLARAVCDRLRRSGLRPAGHYAKLERVLAVSPLASAGGGPRAGRWTGTGRRLSPRSPAGEVVLAYLDAHAARLVALDPAVRRDAPDAIHQMRVTTRRLRAALQAFPMVLPPTATSHLRDELKWLGTVLGTARDTEVLAEAFSAMLAATPTELVIGPVAATVTAHFAPRAAAARDAVLVALDSPRYFTLLDELERLLADPPAAAEATAPASEVLPHAVGRAYRRTRRRMRQAWRMQPGPDRDALLHEGRKAAKRVRYAAEAARPAVGKKARSLARRMKAIQSILGDHHDAVTVAVVAREIGVNAHLSGENAFTFGLLNDDARHEARESQRQAWKAWKRAAGKPRRWLS
jgi:CHAD domain-containing protein